MRYNMFMAFASKAQTFSVTSLDERESLIIRIFLFITVVLLPLSIVVFALQTMYKEEFAAQKVLLRQKLAFQSGMVSRLIQPKYQIKRLAEQLIEKGLLRMSDKRITAYFDRLDRRYPGAFKWLVWDEQGRVRNITSSAALSGKSTWEAGIQVFLEYTKILEKNFAPIFPPERERNKSAALARLQRALGSSIRVEHLGKGYKKVIPAAWLGEACFITWMVEGMEYTEDGIPSRMRGGLLLMVFPDKLPQDFWLKQLILSRPRQRQQIPFPLLTINLYNPAEFYLDPSLQSLPQFGLRTLSAYLNRAEEFFEYDNWLAHSTIPELESPLRVISCANLEKPAQQLRLRLTRLYLLFTVALFVAILAVYGSFGKIELPLRGRITMFFMVALIFPTAGILAIGRSFVAHEEASLRDAARKEMRQTLETLDLRFQDISDIMGRELFTRLSDLIGTDSEKLDESSLLTALMKAENENLISYYFLSDENGNLKTYDMRNEDDSLVMPIRLAMKQALKTENDMTDSETFANVIQDELSNLPNLQKSLIANLCRPTHLNHYSFGDTHIYMMSMRVSISGKSRILIVSVSARLVERYFANREFSAGLYAKKLSAKSYTANELAFYSTLRPAFPQIPEESPVLEKLQRNFHRALNLNAAEEGEITIDNESFLFLISPLQSMATRTYIPCVLTSLKPIQNRILQLRNFLLMMVSFALVTAIALGSALAQSLLVPIRRIDTAVQRVGSGNLDVQLPVGTRDELGRLSSAFNAMVQGLRERERMRAYVSETVLEAVRDNSAAHTIEGEFLEASILFSDIRNFTTLSETYSPKEIFAMLNAFMSEVEPIIRQNEGRVDKFIGDAVMAVFHAGKQHHAIRAVMAALSMMLFLEEFNRKREAEGLFTIKIGIGISTGRVMLGDVGSENRKDLTVIGDEVNLAARLETASKQGKHTKIILSENTFNAVSDLVEVEEMPFKEVKGKQQPVRMFELIRLKQTSKT